MKVNTEININNIAAKLAQSDDMEQAKFFDVFFGESARLKVQVSNYSQAEELATKYGMTIKGCSNLKENLRYVITMVKYKEN
jgi:hypothetical protein